ncbi:penicillin-binding protein 2 [Streptomyces sp. NBC_00083]|uniref:peptidoglycan D,D-transpeptidase FtsI family protein n=1 Tax=Streptomyces sp. NBC_00083 TaxID=2975647 RepID=UPI002258D86F|nr:penicillin-binding protein 2 [Streptomyces sp. NBC_00083]MCX5383946.1 penicillin-binding protein 2 [Streptomyces sp. NBC_00083]
MNKPLRHIAAFCGVMVLALLIRATWVQFVKGDTLANDEHNRRVQITAFSQPRGNIVVGGQPVTGSVATPGSDFLFKRTYEDGPMYAPVTGYLSQAQGATFLEGVHAKVMNGKDDRLFLDRAKSLVTGKTPRGGDVITTIDPDAQKAAYKGLTDLKAKGAVVALDPRSGKILAMASTPSYDPSSFAGISRQEGEEFRRLDAAKDKPLTNRALREVYPPGSTFKILTAAAAIEHGIVSDIDAPMPDAPAPFTLPLSTTQVGNDVDNSLCDKVSLKTGMQWSCNNVFLRTALRTGNDKMRETAEKFGFNHEQFTPVRSAKSGYPDRLDQPGTALTGMGQGSLTSTPLQMAMVTAGLANDGKVMKPYMVEELRGPDLATLEKASPEVVSQAVSAGTARKVQEMMEFTASEGTAKKVRIDGVTVGGKTGTAQHGADVREQRPYAWFVSYAKRSDGTSPVAVAVFVDPADMDIERSEIAGGKLGAPIAKAVMEAVLRK